MFFYLKICPTLMVILLMMPLSGFSKDEEVAGYIDLRLNGAYVLPHHKKMEHLVSGHFLYGELSWGRKTDGQKKWHALYNYPSLGVTLHYNHFAHNEILGNAYAVYPFIIWPLYEQPQRRFSFRFGSGLGYLTNPYHKKENHKNVSISTYLNICIALAFEWEHRLNDRLYFYQSLGLLHFSNGALRMPNTGINLPSAALGIRYKIPEEKTVEKQDLTHKFDKHFYSSFVLAAGLNEIYPTYGDYYTAFSFSMGYNYKTSLKRSLGLNIDLSYNTSDIETLRRRNYEFEKYELLRMGLSLGQTLYFDKTAFVFQVGRYFYTKEKRDGFIYNRVGYKYKLTPSVCASLTLRSHMFRADFIEWGLGVRF